MTHTFAALDMKNAFGEISRAEIFEEVVEVLPEIAPYLTCMWGDAGTPIYVPSGANDWQVLVLLDGLFQGHIFFFAVILLGAQTGTTPLC